MLRFPLAMFVVFGLILPIMLLACSSMVKPSDATQIGGTWSGNVIPVQVSETVTCYVVTYGGEPKSIDCVPR